MKPNGGITGISGIDGAGGGGGPPVLTPFTITFNTSATSILTANGDVTVDLVRIWSAGADGLGDGGSPKNGGDGGGYNEIVNMSLVTGDVCKVYVGPAGKNDGYYASYLYRDYGGGGYLMQKGYPGLNGLGGADDSVTIGGGGGAAADNLSTSAASGGLQNGVTSTSFTTVTEDSSIGTSVWVNLSNALVQDSTYAVTTNSNDASRYLKFTDLVGSVPSDATITGVFVAIIRNKSGASVTTDNSVRLVVGGVVAGDEKATVTAWPSGESTDSYGGDTDLWGLTLTPADVNGSGFGVAISCKTGAGVCANGIDYAGIVVRYTAGTPLVGVGGTGVNGAGSGGNSTKDGTWPGGGGGGSEYGSPPGLGAIGGVIITGASVANPPFTIT